MGERRRRPLNTGAAFRGNHVLARFDRWLRRHPWPAAGLVVAVLFTVDLLSAGPRIALAMKRGKSVDFTGYWQRHIAE